MSVSAALLVKERGQRRSNRWLLAALTGVTAAGAVTPAARGVTFVFPLLAFGLALFFLERSRRHYVSLVCWLFFLTPLLRRLIEFRTGSATASFVMIAPFLACMAGLAAYRHQWGNLLRPELRAWTYVSAALLYGSIVGLLSSPLAGLIQDALGWASPLCFALYVYHEREHAAEILESLRTSFLGGVLLMGLYGLYQFFFLAPWDALWMENSTLTSIGKPERMGVRVFSTMNTPQPLSDYMAFGMLLSLASRKRIRMLAIPIALLTLGLTMSRSGWIGAVVGLLVLSVSFTTRQRLGLVALLLGAVVGLGIATQVPEINEVLSHRLESLNNLGDDSSVNERVASQQRAVALFETSPFGIGLGAGGAASKNNGPSWGVAQPEEVALGDNGIEEIMLSFGWFGSIVFLVGFGQAVMACFQGTRGVPELVGMKAGLIAMLVQIPVMGIFPGASGFLVWTCIAMCFAVKAERAKQAVAEGGAPAVWSFAYRTGEAGRAIGAETIRARRPGGETEDRVSTGLEAVESDLVTE